MWYVIFLDDDGKLFVKNRTFLTLEQAQDYAVTIAHARKPTVLRVQVDEQVIPEHL